MSNINTATYHLAKYLAKLLTPLRESDCVIKSTKDFIETIKLERVPLGFQMVSFDVKSLFTNVPLDRTIEIILKRIYENQEVAISIAKNEMKEMLLLCTKNVRLMEKFMCRLIE